MRCCPEEDGGNKDYAESLDLVYPPASGGRIYLDRIGFGFSGYRAIRANRSYGREYGFPFPAKSVFKRKEKAMELLAYFSSLRPMNLLAALPGNVAQGVIWGIMALGVFITFRLLDFADLTVDGTFATAEP
jgi:hypothetical protein